MFVYLYSHFAFAIADLLGISDDWFIDLTDLGMNFSDIPVASFVLTLLGLIALCFFLVFCFKLFWAFICKVFNL